MISAKMRCLRKEKSFEISTSFGWFLNWVTWSFFAIWRSALWEISSRASVGVNWTPLSYICVVHRFSPEGCIKWIKWMELDVKCSRLELWYRVKEISETVKFISFNTRIQLILFSFPSGEHSSFILRQMVSGISLWKYQLVV